MFVVWSLNHVWLFATPWTLTCQAPLSMEFPRQGYWSGLLFSSPGIFPNQGYNPHLPHCQVDSLSTWQFRSVNQLTFCDPIYCSTPGFPVHQQHVELAQTHVHWVTDAIPPSHLLSSPSSPVFNLSQHQSLFQWVSYSHQVVKVLKLQLQHEFFQWIFRTYFL